MPKVAWSDEDTIEPRMPFTREGDETHAIPNDEWKLTQYEAWRDFCESNYYDGTGPPDFVVVTEIEE